MLHTTYTAIWIFWVLTLLAGEFFIPQIFPYGLAVFLVVEGIAIYRIGRGDTFTEQVRAFHSQEKELMYLIAGFVFWIGFRLINLTGSYEWAVLPGRFSLVSGLVVWLLFHFLGKRGK